MPTTIAAPHPQLNVVCILPNAKFEDSIASQNAVSVHRSMTGSTFSYVKSNQASLRTLPLVLSRMKALELKEFIRVFYRAKWRITLHDGTVWLGQLTQDPFTITAEGRASGWPGSESVLVTLTLSVEPFNA